MGYDAGGAPTTVEVASGKGSNAAPTKKLIAARKKSAKNLKQKDAERKIEAVQYCLQDELFLQEPDVLPLIIGFLSRVKVGVAHERVRCPLSVLICKCGLLCVLRCRNW